MTNCVFCDLANGNSEKVFRHHPGSVVHFEPLNPVTPGHMLFVPKQHVESASEEPIVTANVFYRAADYANEKKRNASDFNLITSAGTNATQTVFHLHVHYVPRRPNDGLHLPWTGQIK